MALSHDQIYKLNLCRLHKRITFLSQILHHDHKDFAPTLWDPNQPSHMNPTERFPKVEVPKAWWPLWKNVLTAIRSSHQIHINKLGPHLSPATVTWLTTHDFRYVYWKHENTYTVHRLLRQEKNRYNYFFQIAYSTLHWKTLTTYVQLHQPLMHRPLQLHTKQAICLSLQQKSHISYQHRSPKECNTTVRYDNASKSDQHQHLPSPMINYLQ